MQPKTESQQISQSLTDYQILTKDLYQQGVSQHQSVRDLCTGITSGGVPTQGGDLVKQPSAMQESSSEICELNKWLSRGKHTLHAHGWLTALTLEEKETNSGHFLSETLGNIHNHILNQRGKYLAYLSWLQQESRAHSHRLKETLASIRISHHPNL